MDIGTRRRIGKTVATLLAIVTAQAPAFAQDVEAQIEESAENPRETTLQDRTIALINEAATERDAGNFTAARGLLENALASLPDDDASLLTVHSLRGHIEGMLGFVIGHDNPAEACGHYATALQIHYEDLTRTALELSPRFFSEQATAYIALEDNAKRLSCEIAPARAVNPDLAGSYYLRGVMETAGGFQLEPNGVVRFYISVGSMDLMEEGTWTSDGTYAWFHFPQYGQLERQLPIHQWLRIEPDMLVPLDGSRARFVRPPRSENDAPRSSEANPASGSAQE